MLHFLFFLVRLIIKPIGVGVGTRVGIGVSLLIGEGEVATSVGDQGALESGLYTRIILIKVND